MASYKIPFTQQMEFIILWLREPLNNQMTKSSMRLQFIIGTQLQLQFTIGTQLQLQFIIGTQDQLLNGIQPIKIHLLNGMDLHKINIIIHLHPQDGTVP